MTRRCRYNCIILALLLCCISVSALILLCATSVWWRPQRRGDTWSRVTLALVRHCNLAHRSHHTTIHCTLYTILHNPLNILIQHRPPHLTSVISKNPHQQQPCLHDNSKYKIFLPSPLSRNYHVVVVQIWNVGRMRSIVLLSLPDFAQFFLSFSPTVCYNIYLDILILDMIDIINPPPTQKTFGTSAGIYQSREVDCTKNSNEFPHFQHF